MREISLHIIDIAENGISAGANCIQIIIEEALKENLLKIVIEDNGKGIPPDMLKHITDPFVTTRTTRRVGLGLSLLESAARRCEGTFDITSELSKGTRVSATFCYDHIDRAPVGDMAGSISLLILGNPDVDIIYTHIINEKDFILDTRELRNELSLTDPMIIFQLTQTIQNKLLEMRSEK